MVLFRRVTRPAAPVDLAAGHPHPRLGVLAPGERVRPVPAPPVGGRVLHLIATGSDPADIREAAPLARRLESSLCSSWRVQDVSKTNGSPNVSKRDHIRTTASRVVVAGQAVYPQAAGLFAVTVLPTSIPVPRTSICAGKKRFLGPKFGDVT